MSSAQENAPPPEEAGEAKPVTQVSTPSGIQIAYYTEPKRKYEVRGPFIENVTLQSKTSEWVEVPSVTTILECLDKPALPWWGMTTGIDAVRSLFELGVITMGFDGQKNGIMIDGGDHFLGKYENEAHEIKDELYDVVNQYKLTVNHVKSRAADRGTGVHNALEAWAAIGKMPDPNAAPWEEKGYVSGLLAFLKDAALGELKPEMMEVTVASIEHGYAGRFDLLARNEKDMRVVTKIYPKTKPKYTTVPAGQRLLIDLKTSKDIYPTHLLQLEAYEGGLVECGYGSTDARAVLHVTADGRYEFRQAKATLADYVAIVGADAALKRVKLAMKV